MRLSPRSQISGASRRRLARWLVGSPIKDIERDLVLETLAKTDGNRTPAARLHWPSRRKRKRGVPPFVINALADIGVRSRHEAANSSASHDRLGATHASG